MKKERIIITAIGISIFILDRITKIFLSKDSVYNTGAVFGLFQGYNSFFIILSIIVSALLMILLKRSSFHAKIFLTFIFAGILSNLFDRVLFGSVIDFIDLGFWPVFNLADVFIMLGVAGRILFSIKKWQL